MDFEERLSKLEENLEFLLDIITQLEIYKIVPSEIVERSKNRIRLKNLQEAFKSEQTPELDKKIKECMNKEILLQKKLNERNISDT